MVTALPPNSGGYITTSFTQNDIGKTNAVKLFTMSSKARKALATKHTQYVGYYGTTSKPNKGTRITPILLPILGIDEDASGAEQDAIVATLSNVASEPQIVIVNPEHMMGSTFRMVTMEFAKALPKKIPRGKPFLNNCRKCATIAALMPTDSDTVKYVLVLVPNVIGIPAGTTATVKGKADESMAEYFADLGDCGKPWLMLQTDLSASVVLFCAALQPLVENNKLEIDIYYPEHSAIVDLTLTNAITFTSPPAVDDEDDAIQPTIADLRAQLVACMTRNMPPTPPATALLPTNIDTDLDSVGGLGAKPATPSFSNTDRFEAKLRLICASYSTADGVGLFDLKDEIKRLMKLGRTAQGEAFCNHLAAMSDTHADSFDCINRMADWPKSYKTLP